MDGGAVDGDVNGDGVLTKEKRGTTFNLFISKITAHNLPNVERLPGDKNDIFLDLKLGNAWNRATEVKAEAGANVIFDYTGVDSKDAEKMKFLASLEDLLNTEALTVRISYLVIS